MNRATIKCVSIMLAVILCITSLNFQVSAEANSRTESAALGQKESPAEKSRKELIRNYAVTEHFIQSELDKGFTLEEVKQALALTKNDKKLTYDKRIKQIRKQAINTSRQVKSTITNNTDLPPRMSLMNTPTEPKVNTKPNEAPFIVNLDNETVSTLTGGLSLRQTDLVLPGRNGLAFALTRVYDSGAAQFYPLDYTTDSTADEKRFPIGKGWTWNISYIEIAGTKKYLHLAGGGTYEIDGTTLKGYPWQDITLTADTNVTVNSVVSAHKLQSIHGISQYFAADGRLIQISDAYDNKIEFKYSTQGAYTDVLTDIVDAIGNTIHITYTSSQVVMTLGSKTVTYIKVMDSGKELLSQVWDPLNRATTYDYRIDPAKYNLQGTTPSVDNPYALIEGVTYPTGAKSVYTYDTSPITRYLETNMVNQVYRVTERKDQLFYDNEPPKNLNVKTITYTGDMGSSPNVDLTFSATIDNGRTLTEFFNKKDYIDANTTAPFYNTKIVSTSGTKQAITDYTYDEARKFDAPIQVASKTVDTGPGGGTSPTSLTVTAYDDYGNVTSTINPLNVMTTYTYNATTHLLESISEPLTSTKTRYIAYTRNSQGDVKQEVVRENGPTGALLQQVDYSSYDSHGNIGEVKVKDTNRDIITTYEYAGAGYQSAYLTKKSITVKDYLNNSSTINNSYEYDLATGAVKKVIDGKNYETTYDYDALGRVTKTTHDDDSFVQVKYDDFNNLLTVIDEEGRTGITKWNPLGWKTDAGILEAGVYKAKEKYEYDDYGRLLRTEDAIGNHTDITYDNWDRQTRVDYPHTYSEISYSDILKKTTVKDPAENEVIETVDLLGRVVKSEEKKPNSSPTMVAEYTYDNAGNVLAAKDALNRTTNYTYDTLGRLTGVLNAKQELTQYTYSMAGHLTQTTYPDQSFATKQYDELGRIIVKKDGNGKEDKYTYDKNSNMVERKDRNLETFTFVYNNRNFLTDKISGDETIIFSYYPTGSRKTMTDATGLTKYEYDKYTGALSKLVYPDGRTIHYSYDLNNRRSQMKDPFGAVTYYAYDGMNRLTAVKSTPDENDAPEAQYAYNASGLLSDVIQKNNVKSTYTYDGLRLDKLTHKKADNSTIQSFDYNYDANGNISSRVENGITNDFVYDELNRIETSNQFAETYDYDSKGNRISFSRNMLFENDNTNLTYDDRDRLTQVTTAGGKTVSYKYNGDNLLYERTENGQTTRYYYDGDQVIAEANVVGGNAELKTRYIRGQGLIAAEDANANKAYYLHNGHGDVIELRDETGNTRLNRYTYDIWGNPVIEEENVHNIFRYSGEMWDDTTSLQYLRARWYDPSDGRFISEDTYEGQIDNPLSLNLYAYVHNNPVFCFLRGVFNNLGISSKSA